MCSGESGIFIIVPVSIPVFFIKVILLHVCTAISISGIVYFIFFGTFDPMA